MSSETPISILLVDDTDDTRMSLRDLLHDNNYSITEASDDKEALILLEAGAICPSFVLVDQVLGRPDAGTNLVTRIRERWPDMFIVMYTANPHIEDWQKWRAIHAGAHRYIRKASAGELLRDVDEIIRDMRELQQLTYEFKEITDARMAMASALIGLDVGVTLIDREYRIWFANQQHAEIIGINKVAGSPCWVYFHGFPAEQGPCTFCIVKETFDNEKSQARDFLSRVSSEKLEWLRAYTVPIFALNLDGSKRVIAIKQAIQRIGNAEKEKDQAGRLRTIARGVVFAGYGRARIYEARDPNHLLGRAASTGPDAKSNRDYNEKFVGIETSIEHDPYAQKAINKNWQGTLFSDFEGLTSIDSITNRDLKPPWIDMPIWDNKRLVGWLLVDNDNSKKTTLAETDIEYLAPFAEEIRCALVEIPGISRVNPILREKVAKARINVSAAQNNDGALLIIMAAIAETIPCLDMWVRLRDDNCLRLLKHLYTSARSLRDTIPMEDKKSPSAYVARSNHALYIDDMEHYREQAQVGNGSQFVVNPPFGKSFAVLPLTIEWVCFGTLCISTKEQVNWDEPGLKPALTELTLIAARLLHDLITNRKEADGKAAAERELMQAFGAIHGIKGPASAIRNYLQAILESQKRGDLTLDKAIKHVSSAARSLTRIERLADRLLRLVQPRKEPLQEIDTGALLEACATESSALYPETTVTFKVNSGAEYFRGGPSEFRAVIDELITNGAKATGGTGHINTTASCDGDVITIAVEDDGHGVEADELKRIFDRWYSGFDGGTGLGLSFVKKVVEDLGGQVSAELPERGLRIVIHIPKTAA